MKTCLTVQTVAGITQGPAGVHFTACVAKMLDRMSRCCMFLAVTVRVCYVCVQSRSCGLRCCCSPLGGWVNITCSDCMNSSATRRTVDTIPSWWICAPPLRKHSWWRVSFQFKALGCKWWLLLILSTNIWYFSYLMMTYKMLACYDKGMWICVVNSGDWAHTDGQRLRLLLSRADPTLDTSTNSCRHVRVHAHLH